MNQSGEEINFNYISTPMVETQSPSSSQKEVTRGSYFQSAATIGIIVSCLMNGNAVSSMGNTSALVSMSNMIPASESVNLSNNSKLTSNNRRENFYTSFVDYTSVSNELNAPSLFDASYSNDKFNLIKQATFDFNPTYSNIGIDPLMNNPEEIGVNNHFFEDLSDKLFMTGYSVFGTASIILFLTWLLNILPIEVGLFGAVLCLTSLLMLGGIKFLFRRGLP